MAESKSAFVIPCSGVGLRLGLWLSVAIVTAPSVVSAALFLLLSLCSALSSGCLLLRLRMNLLSIALRARMLLPAVRTALRLLTVPVSTARARRLGRMRFLLVTGRMLILRSIGSVRILLPAALRMLILLFAALAVLAAAFASVMLRHPYC